MGIKHVETWAARAKCPGCSQYLWTNPGATGVVCACSGSWISDNQLGGDSQVVVNEADFEEWATADLGYQQGEVLFQPETP